jgi:hypothetical protein
VVATAYSGEDHALDLANLRRRSPSAVILGAIFVSRELGRPSLSPRGGEKMSKHSVRTGRAADTVFGSQAASFGPDWETVPESSLFRSYGEVDSNRHSDRVGLQRTTVEPTMQVIANRPEAPSAIRSELGAIFVSMEVSRSSWMITSLSPGSEKMSKHSVAAGDICALRTRFSNLEQKAFARAGKLFPIVVIQEAGLDGFWIHRVLQKEGIESHVVDPASIATSRRRRRAKTDRIDGEALLRTLLAHKRGEPRVCAMVKAPTPEEEDRRRLCRERKVLIAERIMHVNRIKGLLFGQLCGRPHNWPYVAFPNMWRTR